MTRRQLEAKGRRRRSEFIHFATAMRNMRRTLEMDQPTLANRLGTSTRTLSDWENGYAAPVAEKRLHFVYAINDISPEHTETFAGLLGVLGHPAVVPLLEPDVPEAPPPVADAVAQEPPAPPPPPVAPPNEPAPPTREELRTTLDRVVRDAADVVDVRASDLRKGIRAVLTAIAGSGSSLDDVLAALEITPRRMRDGAGPASEAWAGESTEQRRNP